MYTLLSCYFGLTTYTTFKCFSTLLALHATWQPAFGLAFQTKRLCCITCFMTQTGAAQDEQKPVHRRSSPIPKAQSVDFTNTPQLCLDDCHFWRTSKYWHIVTFHQHFSVRIDAPLTLTIRQGSCVDFFLLVQSYAWLLCQVTTRFRIGYWPVDHWRRSIIFGRLAQSTVDFVVGQWWKSHICTFTKKYIFLFLNRSNSIPLKTKFEHVCSLSSMYLQKSSLL